ncbi:hypothetical protein JVU11DRAFT_8568 [Chiua virens]|nr:hypothetical protein JVU11DRAFT_8568 [Chiua virens]
MTFNLWEDLGAGTITFIKAHVAYFASLLALYTMNTFFYESPFGSGIFLTGFLFLKLSIMGLMAFGVTLITLLYVIRVFVMMVHFHRTYQQQADADINDTSTSSRALLVLIFALWVADRLDFKLDESSKELFRKIVAFNGRLSETVFLVLFLIMAVILLGLALDGLWTQGAEDAQIASNRAVNAANRKKRRILRKNDRHQ